MKTRKKVSFPDGAELTIKGTSGGRGMVYEANIKEFTVVVDDHTDLNELDFISKWDKVYLPPTNTYTLEIDELAPLDDTGAMVRYTVSKKDVTHIARTYYGHDVYVPSVAHEARKECGAPLGSTHKINFEQKTIEFTWTEKV